MSKKPTVLMILDGFGLNDKTEGNAVAQAKKPNIDALMKEYPFVKGNASGLAVGLPDGQMGNSEVGHLNMGAGRIVYQELTRITKEINDGEFFSNQALLDGIANVKENNSDLHLYGLLSDGGVHSHITHLYGLLELAKRQGVKNVYVHCFLDGRDTAPTSGKGFIEALEAKMAAMRDAQKVFATYTQEQVDKIFFEAAMAANKQRIPLSKLAVEETGMGVVEDKVIKNHYAAEYIYNKYKNESYTR